MSVDLQRFKCAIPTLFKIYLFVVINPNLLHCCAVYLISITFHCRRKLKTDKLHTQFSLLSHICFVGHSTRTPRECLLLLLLLQLLQTFSVTTCHLCRVWLEIPDLMAWKIRKRLQTADCVGCCQTGRLASILLGSHSSAGIDNCWTSAKLPAQQESGGQGIKSDTSAQVLARIAGNDFIN